MHEPSRNRCLSQELRRILPVRFFGFPQYEINCPFIKESPIDISCIWTYTLEKAYYRTYFGNSSGQVKTLAVLTVRT